MALKTTTIGSYPKPGYVPVPRWSHRAPPGDKGFLRGRSDEDQQRIEQGTREIVREQDRLGLDILTDGEVRREHPVYDILRRFPGFDFERLSERETGTEGETTHVPTVNGQIRPAQRFLRYEWRSAQAVTAKPVKMTLPGPLTVWASTFDDYYGDPQRFCAALGDALNAEIRDLAEAGCPWVQIDDPLLCREPELALAFGIDNLVRCFHKIAKETVRAVHICGNNPLEDAGESGAKEPPALTAPLAEALDLAALDAVSLEDARRRNDPRILETFAQSTVLLGVVDVTKPETEDPEDISSHLRTALDHIDRHRLIAAPDCGLAALEREQARAKLKTMVAAARDV